DPTDNYWSIFWDEDGVGPLEKACWHFTWEEIEDLFDTTAIIQDLRIEAGKPYTSESSTVYIDDIEINTDTYGLEKAMKTVETNELGSFETTFKVPARGNAEYFISGLDEDGATAKAEFTIGPCITLDVDEGPSGTVVDVEARGYTADDETAIPKLAVEISDDGDDGVVMLFSLISCSGIFSPVSVSPST
ncbi:unnamed protein product, partial [marine sediment metagenome]